VKPLEIALRFIERGWNPIPVSRRTKKPIGTAWQKQPVKTAKDAPRYFNGSSINVGVQMGKKSKGLSDVDLDCGEAVIIGGLLLPNSGAVFGRKSKLRSHWLYYSNLASKIDKAAVQFRDTDHTMMLELRIGGSGKGAQSVFPGSVHSSGETIEWDSEGEPARIEDDELLRSVEHIAAATMLARGWPPKGQGRHETALTLGGFLARAGFTEDDAARLMTAIAKAVGGGWGGKEAAGAREAVKRHAKGEAVRGYPALEAAFGADVATKVAEWLRYDGSTDKTRARPALPKRTLDEVHRAFRKWLGAKFDLDAIDVTLAAAASEPLGGDPLWILVVSGSGAGKTEAVTPLEGAGAHIVSTITSEGALLSASPQKQRSKTATGGLLRKIGDRGVLVIKDVTSILSADRNVRAAVLAALREIHDGKWTRNVGSDGGQTLSWQGRIVVVGAVTTAWDAAHAVVSTMGDRFVLLRLDSTLWREESGLRALANVGKETQMRQELAVAVGGLLDHAAKCVPELAKAEIAQLVKLGNVVTMARTPIERDFKGEAVDAHAPEMPTRLSKQLGQIVRGGAAIGMTRAQAMRLAVRCARDSIPPLRLEILLDVAAHPETTPGETRKRINRPFRTVRREMEALSLLRVLYCDETEDISSGTVKTIWRYRPNPDFDRDTLLAMADLDPTSGGDGNGAAKPRRPGNRKARPKPKKRSAGSGRRGNGAAKPGSRTTRAKPGQRSPAPSFERVLEELPDDEG
jgi:hypothetical protein